MAIELDIHPKLEAKLREMAQAAGLDVDRYIIDVLEGQLDRLDPDFEENSDDFLLQNINLGISSATWDRYHELVEKRKAERISEAEHEELISLSDRIEAANARRMTFLVKLANKRSVSLEQLIKDLGISVPSYV